MTDIDVRGSISIETLVPVVLTDVERLVSVRVQYATAENNLERITLGLSNVADAGIVEKITLTLPHITELLLIATTTLATDIKAAEVAVSEAKALTDSITGMSTFPMIDEAAEPGVVATSTSMADETKTSSTTKATSTKRE